MNPLVQKVQQWLPSLLSKKLGVAILAFIAEFNSKPHQTTKQIVIAVIGGVYIAAQAFLDAKTTAAPSPSSAPGTGQDTLDAAFADPAEGPSDPTAAPPSVTPA